MLGIKSNYISIKGNSVYLRHQTARVYGIVYAGQSGICLQYWEKIIEYICPQNKSALNGFNSYIKIYEYQTQISSNYKSGGINGSYLQVMLVCNI